MSIADIWFFELNFEINPVAKARPRVISRNGRAWAYTPKKSKHFEETIKLMASQKFKGRPLTGPIEVLALFNLEKPKSPKNKRYPVVKPDVDNLFKSVADALNKIAWNDDSQIVKATIEKKYSENGFPSISLKFKELA